MPDLGLVALSFVVVAVGFHSVISRDLKADRLAAKARKDKRDAICRRD